MRFSELKDRALEKLDPVWWPSVGVTLVYFFVSSTASSSTFYFGGVVVFGPLGVGLANYYLKISRNQETKIEDLFVGFQNFGNTFLLGLLQGLFIVLWSFLFIIPGIIAALAYSQAFYIMADDPTIKPMDALKKSREMMDGYKWDLFLLGLSFIGWALLCILTLGIGFLWLTPYMQATFAQFYFELKGDEGVELIEEFGIDTDFD